jgi:hypothetical protein
VSVLSAVMVEIERARRPFWMHQLVEYLIGIVLISAAIQMLEPAIPAVLGLVVLLNAAIATGPAGAFRVVSKSVHRRLDVAVMALLVAAAVQPWIHLDMTSRLLLGAIAFVLFFVWFHTDFADRLTRAERRDSSARPASEDVGRQAGRLVGDTVNSLKRWKDSRETGADGGSQERP